MKPHTVRSVHGVRSASRPKSPDGKHAKQVVNPEHIPVEFDYASAPDMPGGPKISMMVATHSFHGRCDAEFSKLHRSVGIGDGRIKM